MADLSTTSATLNAFLIRSQGIALNNTAKVLAEYRGLYLSQLHALDVTKLASDALELHR